MKMALALLTSQYHQKQQLNNKTAGNTLTNYRKKNYLVGNHYGGNHTRKYKMLKDPVSDRCIGPLKEFGRPNLRNWVLHLNESCL